MKNLNYYKKCILPDIRPNLKTDDYGISEDF